MDSAEKLFGSEGYASTPLGVICEDAGVTKGAMYHHFSSKQELYEAVFERACTRTMADIVRVLGDAAGEADPWARTLAALRVWLRAISDDDQARRVMTEAPSVLGWDRWRELDQERNALIVSDAIQFLVDEGVLADVSVPTVSQLVFSLLVEGAMMIAHADDRDAERARVEAALVRMVSGLRR